jgi:hypothetical protein
MVADYLKELNHQKLTFYHLVRVLDVFSQKEAWGRGRKVTAGAEKWGLGMVTGWSCIRMPSPLPHGPGFPAHRA